MDEQHPDDYGPEPEEDRERFRIENDQTAAWAMRKLRSIRRRLADIDNLANQERQRINEWADSSARSQKRDLDYFTAILSEYGRRQRDEEDRKTVTTPYGTIKTRAGSEQWAIDEAEFLPWAERCRPDLVKIRKSPDLAAAKKSLSLTDTMQPFDPETGEAVPGIIVEHGEPSITVEVNL